MHFFFEFENVWIEKKKIESNLFSEKQDIEMNDSSSETTNFFFLREVNTMPRRTQAQILQQETESFLGPIRTDMSQSARGKRRANRIANMEQNYNQYRRRIMNRRQLEQQIVGEDTSPETCILPFIQRYRGRRIRIMVYSTGPEHLEESDELEESDGRIVLIDLNPFNEIAHRGVKLQHRIDQVQYADKEYNIPFSPQDRKSVV